MKNFSQRGFTLVELIVVIVILGILAATALPKFIDLSSDARGGVMKGVEASMRGTNVMIYGKAAAKGYQSAAVSAVTINGTSVDIVYGYANNATTLAGQMELNPAGDFIVNAGDIQHAKATNPATCRIVYTPATSASAGPTYTAELGGC